MLKLWKLRPSIQPLLQHVIERSLSSTQTSTALRPFYFAVHPDLFGQFPKERAVNEDSLKRLSEYLDGLRTNRRVSPTSLLFYVKNGQKEKKKEIPSTLREVRVSLLSQCTKETVRSVLRSANLSLNYVDSIKGVRPIDTKDSFYRPIKWHPSFYEYYGIPNPFAEEIKKKPQVTLSSWLHNNMGKVQQKQEAFQPILDQVKRLKEHIKAEAGVVDVKLDHHWGYAHFRACLLSFIRLYERHSDELRLKGSTLVFGSETGICLQGHIILRIDDVPTSWLKSLKKMRRQAQILAELPSREAQLSRQLNNISVVRPPFKPTVVIDEYMVQLNRLIQTVDQYWADNPDIYFDQDLSDLELVLECAPSKLSISPEGHILVPSSCPAFMLVSFLQRSAHQARVNKQQFTKDTRVCDLIEEVKQELRLQSLTYDNNVTLDEMETCCRHLLEDPRNIGVSMDGCRLRVSKFYTVYSDGEIAIPWNWIGVQDND